MLNTNNLKAAMIASLLLTMTQSVAALEFEYGGFVSLVAGKVLSGDEANILESYGGNDCPCFISDFPDAGFYEDDGVDFNPDSTLGLQGKVMFYERFSVMAQVVANGANDYDPNINFLYFRTDITSNLSIDIGRKRIPLFFYSDFYDVGYAYPWLRVPGEVYGWPLTSYNGISATYSGELGDAFYDVSVFYGSEDDDENESYSELFYFVPVEIKWEEMQGISFETSYNWLTARVVYMKSKNTTLIHDPDYGDYFDPEDATQTFIGFAFNVEYEGLLVNTEINQFELGSDFESQGYLVGVGYLIHTFTPMVTYSHYEDEGGFIDIDSDSISYSLRWDFMDSAALTAQYNDLTDNADGDAKVVALGVDYIF